MKAPLLLSTLLFVSSCKEAPKATAPVAPTVILTEVSQKEIIKDESYVGRVIADEMVEIKARVNGELMKQAFKEGQTVKKGDVLFLIEQDQYIANLEQEKANLESAQANVKLSKKTFERMKASYAKKAVPKIDVDVAENDAAQAVASVHLANAKIKSAELDLKWTKIVAPVDGRLGVVSVSVGNMLTENSPSLVTLTKDNFMEVELTINEKVLVYAVMKRMAKTKQDNKERKSFDFSFINVELSLPGGVKYEHKGEVLFIDNRINPTTGSVKVRTRFPNPNGMLVDGMYVKVRTYIDKPESALIIPQACVLEDQLGKYVLLVNEKSIVEKRSIVVEKEHGADFVLKSGLKSGEKIILQGLQKVSPGKEVKTTMAQQEK